MAAITGVITAVAGLGLTAYQMYQSSEDQKAAESASKQAAQQLKSIKETNPYSAVQAPDVSALAFQQNAAMQASTVEALQGMGAEGAAQIAQVDQIARANALQASESQASINYQRDIEEAKAGADIEMRRAMREGDIASMELSGAQLAAAEAKAKKQAGAANLVTGVGNLATGIGTATSLESQAQRAAKKAPSAAGQTEAEEILRKYGSTNPLGDWNALTQTAY